MVFVAFTICTSSSLDTARENMNEKIPNGISKARVIE
jgi:hypothetical protein